MNENKKTSDPHVKARAKALLGGVAGTAAVIPHLETLMPEFVPVEQELVRDVLVALRTLSEATNKLLAR